MHIGLCEKSETENIGIDIGGCGRFDSFYSLVHTCRSSVNVL